MTQLKPNKNCNLKDMKSLDPAEIKGRYQHSIFLFAIITMLILGLYYLITDSGGLEQWLRRYYLASLMIVVGFWSLLQAYFGIKYEMLGDIFDFPEIKRFQGAKYWGIFWLIFGLISIILGITFNFKV